MGKYSKLRKTLKPFAEKPKFQARIDAFKQEFLGTTDAENANTAMLAKEFCERERAKDKLEAQVHALNVEIAGFSQFLVHTFENDGLEKLNLSDGVTIGLKDRVCVTVEDRKKLLGWLKKEYPEVWQKIVSVNAKVLAELCGNLIVEGKKAPPGTVVTLKTSAAAYGLGPPKEEEEE